MSQEESADGVPDDWEAAGEEDVLERAHQHQQYQQQFQQQQQQQREEKEALVAQIGAQLDCFESCHQITVSSSQSLPFFVVNFTAATHGMVKPGEVYYEVEEQLKQAIAANFSEMSESLFEANAAWYVDPGDAEDFMDALEETNEDCCYAVLRCPDEIDGQQCFDLWEAITRPTAWPCLNLIKLHVQACLRPLVWKAGVCLELEAIASREQSREREDADDHSSGDNVDPNAALPEMKDMGVLDLLLSMVLGRHPRMKHTEADYWEHVWAIHRGLRTLWMLEFGRLPPPPQRAAGVSECEKT